MLDESVLLQIPILALGLLFLCGWVELRLVMDHVIEGKLSQVEFFGLDELLLEFTNVCNQPDSSALVEVSRFVDPYSFRLVVHEFNFVRHHIQSVCFGEEGRQGRNHLLSLLGKLQLQFLQGFEKL